MPDSGYSQDELFSRVAEARFLLNRECPFLGHLLNRVPIRFDPSVETALVTNRGELGEMWLGTEFFGRMDRGETASILLHETLHLAGGVFFRRGWREAHLWNIAHDIAIDGQISAFMAKFPSIGLKWPVDAPPLTSREYAEGKTAEEIYDELVQAAQERRTPESGHPAPPTATTVPRDEARGTTTPNSTDVPRPSGSGRGFPDGTDVVLGATPVGIEATQAHEQDQEQGSRWIEILREAAAVHETQMPGTLPGRARDILKGALNTKSSWVEELFHQVDGHLPGGPSTYSRPSKRGLGMDLLLPRRSRRLPRIAMILDTSGSMTARDLEAYLGTMREIVAVHNPSVRLIQIDTEVQEDREIEDFELEFSSGQFEIAGGGGTDFTSLPEALLYGEGDEVDLAIILTDGYADWPPASKWPVPVVVVTTGESPTGYRCIRMVR